MTRLRDNPVIVVALRTHRSLTHSLTHPRFFLAYGVDSACFALQANLLAPAHTGRTQGDELCDSCSRNLALPSCDSCSRQLYRRRPVRRDRSFLTLTHSLRLLGFNEAPSPRRCQLQRARLADGSYMLVRGRENPWISRGDFSENFTPSRETQSLYWENTP